MFQSFSCSLYGCADRDNPKDIISITLPVLNTHIDADDEQPDDYQNNIILIYLYKRRGDSLKWKHTFLKW